MNTQIGPATGYAANATCEHQGTCRVAHGAAIRRHAEIGNALAEAGPAALRSRPTIGKLGLADRDVEPVLPYDATKLKCGVDIAARGIDNDRQFAGAELFQHSLEQSRRVGSDGAFR